MQQHSEKRPKRRFTLPISWKLLGATAVVGAVAAVIAVIGLKRIQTLHENLTQTVDFLATKVTLASLVKQDLVTVTRAERNMVLARSKDATDRFATVIDEVVAEMDGRVNELRQLVKGEDRKRLDTFSERWRAWRENHDDVRRFAVMNSDLEAHSISVGAAREAIDRMESALQAIARRTQGRLDAANQNGDDRLAAESAETLALVATISQAGLEMQRAEKDLILAETEDEMRQYENALEPLKLKLEQRIDQLGAATGAADEDAVADVRQAADEYFQANARIRTAASERSSFLTYHYVYTIGAPLADECELLLDGLIESNEQEMQEHRRAGRETYANARNALLGISIAGILVSVAISFSTGQRIARRLATLSRFAGSIQNTGDLSKPTPKLGHDEVGVLAESFDQMRLSLHQHASSVAQQAARLSELTRSLETKNREMEQFVYTVSHDLKSPLVSCKGLLGLLKEDVAGRDHDAVLESLERMEHATDQLNQIIDDLLMLSSIRRKSLKPEAIDVRELLDDLSRELSDRIEEAGARLGVEPDLPPLIADKTDARRVFENLLTNALKYGCRATQPTIEVGGKSHDEEVRYFVRDDGPGIDPKYHEKIFGLFQRLDTDQPGTGLGLASVAKIMNIHGGRAWVESAPNQGATFWVAFPRSS